MGGIIDLRIQPPGQCPLLPETLQLLRFRAKPFVVEFVSIGKVFVLARVSFDSNSNEYRVSPISRRGITIR